MILYAKGMYSAKPKGMRLGYMGHLTFIADEIIKLFEGYPETIVNHIKDDIDLQSWNEYCANQLRETKERDRLPLAGPRPNDGMDAATDEDEEEETLEGTAASQVRVIDLWVQSSFCNEIAS